MKKIIWLVIILAIIILILAGVLLFWPSKTGQNNQQQNQNQQDTQQGIKIILPKENEEVSSPLKITGLVNGNGWSGFEGQVGTVKLVDGKGNELASGILMATSIWTRLPTYFETTLNFTAVNSGLATLIFKNENASGDPSRDKTFSLPVMIK